MNEKRKENRRKHTAHPHVLINDPAQAECPEHRTGRDRRLIPRKFPEYAVRMGPLSPSCKRIARRIGVADFDKYGVVNSNSKCTGFSKT